MVMEGPLRDNDTETGGLSRGIESWLVPAAEDDPTETIGERAPAAAAPCAADEFQAGPSLELQPGALLLDRYALGEPLARGGQSIVFRGYDLENDGTSGSGVAVAIKVLRDGKPSDAAIARLRREFRQSQSLRHPGVARMFNLDCDRGTWFVVMELLEGMSLRTRLNRIATQPLGVPEALRIADAGAAVLGHAHRHGITHGDIKPGNVFLQEGGGVKVLDFGAAYDIQPAPPGTPLGTGLVATTATRTYASPEVLDGLPAGPRDDIFSFACVAYEMLAGRHPFSRVPANEARLRSMEASPIAGLSALQNAVLAAGLAWSRAERPPSIEAWIDALLDDAHGPAAHGRPRVVRESTLAQWLPWRWIGAVALGAGLLLFFATWWSSHAGRDRQTASGLVPGPSPLAPGSAELAPPHVTPRPRENTAQTSDPAVIVPSPAQPPVAAPSTKSGGPVVVSRARTAAPGPVRIKADNTAIRISEGAAAAVVTLRRSGSAAGPVAFTWQLVDGSAHSGSDFAASARGRASFARGQTTRTIYVPLINDHAPELEEFFSLLLASPTVGIDGSNRIVITIVDDD
jgi:serine/threonine protein kinase